MHSQKKHGMNKAGYTAIQSGTGAGAVMRKPLGIPKCSGPTDGFIDRHGKVHNPGYRNEIVKITPILASESDDPIPFFEKNQ